MLRKALYGLKQASRAWFSRINSYFQQMGFIQSINEPMIYRKHNGSSNILKLCLYVDDIIYMGNSSEMLKQFKENMMKMFEMFDLGYLKYFLGLDIVQGDESIFSQRKYAEDFLNKAGMLHCNPIFTPLKLNEKLHLQDSSGKTDPNKYRMLVGSLLYVTQTWPDITHVVGVVAKYMQAPSMHHYRAVKRILRYVKGMMEFGIQYKSKSNLTLTGYSDNDWGGSSDNRSSTMGWVFMLGSDAVAWCSKKKQITTLLSTKAKYMSVTSAACEAVWLR